MANAKKKDEAVVESVAVPVEKPIKKKAVKLDDSVLVNVKSNAYGTLYFKNPRTGDETNWSHFGDTQTVTMGDLRAMKGTQRAFYEKQWIYIVNVEDEEYSDVTPDEVYKALMVSQYYKNIVDPDNFNQIFTMSEAKLRERVEMMSSGAKMNLVVASNTAILNGTLDSLKKIKLLEELLGCELDRPE